MVLTSAENLASTGYNQVPISEEVLAAQQLEGGGVAGHRHWGDEGAGGLDNPIMFVCKLRRPLPTSLSLSHTHI